MMGVAAPIAMADEPGPNPAPGPIQDEPSDPPNPVLNGWHEADGHRYYYVEGEMHTSWLKLDEATYYFFSNGVMAIGWTQIQARWYYFNADGVMQTSTWVPSGGYWYFLDGEGRMATGWLHNRGTWYYLDQNGAMQANTWLQVSGKWYYFGHTGAMATNQWIGDCYVRGDGSMFMGETSTIGGYTYHFDWSGRWVSVNGPSCPAWAPIKGNSNSMIYHLPGQQFYNVTNPEKCFAHESDARAAGYRKSQR